MGALHTTTPRRQAATQRGLTLVELAAVLAVIGVLAGAVMPSWQGFLDRRALAGASARLGADLQYLRSAAVARNEPLRIGFQTGAAASCYVIHTGPAGACDCLSATAVRCTDGAQALRRLHLDAAQGVHLRASTPSLRVDPRQGSFSPTGTLRLQSREGSTVAHVINLLGRVRTCASRADAERSAPASAC